MAEAEVKVHALMSRGPGAEAQALLALVSTETEPGAGEDVWVGIDIDAPRRLWADSPSDAVEAGRPVSWDELVALDAERTELRSPPFGLEQNAAARYWLARFDFSDHTFIQARWQAFTQAAGRKAPVSMTVTAWRSQIGRDEFEGKDYDAYLVTGVHARREFAVSDVLAQPLFDLGVLLVHGIGKHEPRETLVLWSEPIVQFWRDRARAISADAAASLGKEQRARLEQSVRRRQLRNRTPLDGISEALSDFAKARPASTAAPERVSTARTARKEKPLVCVATVKPEQTLFSGSDEARPSAALLRLSSLDSSAVLRESHALFAEAYWTRETFPPTFAELFAWITNAVPVVVWARLQRLGLQRFLDIRTFAKDAAGPFDAVRLGVALAIWLVQIVVLPTAYVLGGLVLQIVVGLVGLVGVIVPVPWLRSLARTVVSTLLGTVGQSYALQSSPIRRSAIVSAVEDKLDWLQARCRRVVVLSHSQGAEISRRVFVEQRRPRLARWYTFGAGIAPLTMLSPKSLDEATAKLVIRTSKLGLAVAALSVMLLAIDASPGMHFGLWQALQHGMRQLDVRQLVLAYAVLSVAAFSVFGLEGGPSVEPMLRVSVMQKWRDFYASRDPVPAGSLFDRFSKDDLTKHGIGKMWQRRVFNTRFALLDHTSYWKNVEEFVAPIALDLLRMLDMGSNERIEARALYRARKRRDLLTGYTMVFVLAGLLLCLAALWWPVFGPSQRGLGWWHDAQVLWAGDRDLASLLGAIWAGGLAGQVLANLWLPLALIAVLVVGLACRAWLGRLSAEALVRGLARAARRSESAASGLRSKGTT